MQELKEKLKVKWKHWRYKNTFFSVVSLLFFIFFINHPFVQNIMKQVGSFGYAGVFLCGVLFVSTFTVVPSIALLYEFAGVLNPWWVAIIAGLGTMVGDYFVFKFLRDGIFEEIGPIFAKLEGSFLKKIFASPFFVWLTPIIGAILIASPVPDEIGVSMMGLSKIKLWQFMLISFCLGFIAIFMVVLLAGAKF